MVPVDGIVPRWECVSASPPVSLWLIRLSSAEGGNHNRVDCHLENLHLDNRSAQNLGEPPRHDYVGQEPGVVQDEGVVEV